MFAEEQSGQFGVKNSRRFMVKVCGITNLEDALRSIELGANALGFNLYLQSPRYIDPGEVEKIIQELPEHVLTVAVMVVRGEDVLSTTAKASSRVPSIGAFQLHGLHSESEIPPAHKTLYVATSPVESHRFPNHEILIDTSWGRGMTANWEELRQIDRSFILSGGLRPENVAEAIELLQPAGVDVCSGVEEAPGTKDVGKLRRFMENVRGAKNRSPETGE